MKLVALGNLPAGSRYYLNATSVGEGGDNRSGPDVELVQFFLRYFYQQHPEYFAKLPRPGRGVTALAIDGKVGPQTIAGIRVFQEFQRRIGQATAEGESGKVNVVVLPPAPVVPRPARRGGVFGDTTGDVAVLGGGGTGVVLANPVRRAATPTFTITRLNDYFFRYQGNINRNGPYMNRLHTYPLVQSYPALRAELARVEGP